MRIWLACLALWATPAAAQDTSMPALVDALFGLQDRAARGERDAADAHSRLTLLVARRLDEGAGKDLSAAHVADLALSGTDARVVRRRLRRSFGRKVQTVLLRLVMALVERDAVQAKRLMPLVALDRLPRRTAALLRLAHASLLAAGDDEPAARALLERNVVAMPGTLIEEASLRRLFALAMLRDDAPAALTLARRYAWRFARSPYRDALVRTLPRAALAHERMVGVHDVWARLTPGDERETRFATARTFALAGRVAELPSLLAHEPRSNSHRDRLRTRFLALLADLVGPDPERARARLDWIGTEDLEPADRSLLLAARAVARRITEPVSVDTVVGRPRTPSAFVQAMRTRIGNGEAGS